MWEEGLRAAALPGRVAPADAVALDAGPRADERVGHIYQSVFGFALREQIFLRWKGEPSHGGVARVPQARQVLHWGVYCWTSWASGSLIDDVGETKSSAI